jgi:hypothetical protein
MATKKVITQPTKPQPTKPQNNSGKPPRNFVIPVAFPNAITSVFNDPRNYSFAPNRLQLHEGIDFAPPRGYQGDLPVIAAAAGRVVDIRNDPRGYGNYVVIRHDNGYDTLYAHLANIAVRAGDILTQGQRVGTAGNTGNSSDTHLHFNIIDRSRSRGNYVYGGVVDPSDFLSSPGTTARSITTQYTKPISPITNRNRPKPERQDLNPNIPGVPGWNSNLLPNQQPAQPYIISGGSVPVNSVIWSTTPQPNSQNVVGTTVDTVNTVGETVKNAVSTAWAENLDDINERVSNVIPFVFAGIIALAIAIISAYKFIKD